MRYRILGSIEVDGKSISSPQERRLLAILLLTRNKAVSIRRAREVVWGSQIPLKAKVSLQSKVSRLRAVVGTEQIRLTEAGYVLDVEPGECDADRFEAIADELIRRQDLQEQERLELIDKALDLWQGEFLGELTNEDFVDGEAIRLEGRRMSMSEDRVAVLLDLGRLDGALATIDLLADSQPFNDRLCELRMLALARSGRSVDALRAFQDYRSRLRDEIGVAPTQELVALERRILDGQVQLDTTIQLSPTPNTGYRPSGVASGVKEPSIPRPGRASVADDRWNQTIVSRPPFIGRESYLASIRRMLLEADGPEAMLILGDGGIGKTRLVMEASQMAGLAKRSLTVLRCRDRPAGAFAPLAKLGELDDSQWQSTAARQRVVSHYTEALRTKVKGRSMLIVEDLHWADQGTLEVLDSLVTAVTNDDSQLVLVLTSRPLIDNEPLAAWQSRFVRDLSTTTMELDGFSEPEIFQLIERSCDARPNVDLSDQLYDHSGGNPLLTLTGLHNLRGQGSLRFDGRRLGTATEAFATIPADLADALDRILARLDADTKNLLIEVSGSVAAPTIEQLPIGQTLPERRLRAAIDQAELAGLVASVDGRIQIVHDLFGRIIIERLSSSEQYALHLKLFRHRKPDGLSLPEALDSLPTADLFALAHHGERAGPLIDFASKFHSYERAAHRSLTITDWPRAAHFYRAARRLGDKVALTHNEWLRLDTYTGIALFRTHDASEALPLLDAVIEEAERLNEGELWGLALADHQRAESTIADTGIAARPSRDRIERFVKQNYDRDPTQCARLLSLSAENHFFYGEINTAAGLAKRASRIAADQDDRILNAEVSCASGLVALGELSLQKSAEHFQASAATAAEVGSGWIASWGLGRLAFVRLLEAEFAAAAETARTARVVQTSAASWAELSFTATIDAQLAFANSDSAGVIDAANEAERLLNRTGFAFTAHFLYPLLLHIAFESGDLETFDATLQRWIALPSNPPRVFDVLRCALVEEADVLERIAELRPLTDRPLGPAHLVPVSARCILASLFSEDHIVADTGRALQQLERAGVRYLPGQRTPVSQLRNEFTQTSS